MSVMTHVHVAPKIKSVRVCMTHIIAGTDSKLEEKSQQHKLFLSDKIEYFRM